MDMAMRMETMRCATEAAVSHTAVLRPPSIRVGPLPRPAVPSRHETHRHGADSRRTHHGQDHAARAFHVAVPPCCSVPEVSDSLSLEGSEASKSQPPHRIVRHKPLRQLPPEKWAVNARANEPKPPRVTPPEPESDEVPDGERLDEGSPP